MAEKGSIDQGGLSLESVMQILLNSQRESEKKMQEILEKKLDQNVEILSRDMNKLDNKLDQTTESIRGDIIKLDNKLDQNTKILRGDMKESQNEMKESQNEIKKILEKKLDQNVEIIQGDMNRGFQEFQEKFNNWEERQNITNLKVEFVDEEIGELKVVLREENKTLENGVDKIINLDENENDKINKNLGEENNDSEKDKTIDNDTGDETEMSKINSENNLLTKEKILISPNYAKIFVKQVEIIIRGENYVQDYVQIKIKVKILRRKYEEMLWRDELKFYERKGEGVFSHTWKRKLYERELDRGVVLYLQKIKKINFEGMHRLQMNFYKKDSGEYKRNKKIKNLNYKRNGNYKQNQHAKVRIDRVHYFNEGTSQLGDGRFQRDRCFKSKFIDLNPSIDNLASEERLILIPIEQHMKIKTKFENQNFENLEILRQVDWEFLQQVLVNMIRERKVVFDPGKLRGKITIFNKHDKEVRIIANYDDN